MLREGWYLMNTVSLEGLLRVWRTGEYPSWDDSDVVELTQEEALAYRNAGNLPDDLDRSLRLVLLVESFEDLQNLETKRLAFEPDYHDSPTWRRPGSKPVNLVPLRAVTVRGGSEPWWDQEDVGLLEREWQATGRVEDLVVPGDYRSFVFKTVAALRRAGLPVTSDTVMASISRWVPVEDATEISAALRAANESG